MSEKLRQQLVSVTARFSEDKVLLVTRVFDDVKSEESWKAFCRNPDVLRHIDKVISVESLAPIHVTESSLGIGLITELLQGSIPSQHFVESLTEFLENDVVTLVTRAPVYSLIMQARYPIDLGDGVQLVLPPLSDEFTIPTPLQVDIRPAFVFEHKWREKKTISEETATTPTGLTKREPVGMATLRRLVYSLLLVGKCRFRAPFGEVKAAPGLHFGYREYFHAPPWIPPSNLNVDHMNADEVERFQKAWRDMSAMLSVESLNRSEWLATSLSRMEIAHERDDSRDALIDICTSLEALLTHEDIPELAYRFRQRGAFLYSLGQKSLLKDDVEKVREDLREAYAMRSDFVHGDTSEYREEEVRRVFERSAELCRVFCLKLIALGDGRSHKDLLSKDLDLAMVSIDKTRELEETLKKSPIGKYWT